MQCSPVCLGLLVSALAILAGCAGVAEYGVNETTSEAVAAEAQATTTHAPAGTEAATPLPFFSIEAQGASDEEVVRALALEVGNTWLYDYTYKSAIGSTGKIITIRYGKELRVLEHCRTSDGLVVVMGLSTRGVQFDYPDGVQEGALTWFKRSFPEKDASHYLIRDGYVFGLLASVWDDENKVVEDTWLDRRAEWFPDFFFPMSRGVRWTRRPHEESDRRQGELWKAGKAPAPNPGIGYGIVMGTEMVRVPFGEVRDALRVTYPSLCGMPVVWLKEGIGMVKEAFRHGGSYYECETVLREFRRAAPGKRRCHSESGRRTDHIRAPGGRRQRMDARDS